MTREQSTKASMIIAAYSLSVRYSIKYRVSGWPRWACRLMWTTNKYRLRTELRQCQMPDREITEVVRRLRKEAQSAWYSFDKTKNF